MLLKHLKPFSAPVIEKHRQSEQKQSRMTGKKAACLVLHAFSKSKERKMVRKQHFPPTNRKHAYQTAHLQSMKREHFVSGRRSSSEERNSCLALGGDYT